MKSYHFLIPVIFFVAVVAGHGASISINFSISGNDNNSVNSDESATSLVAGANWNNLVIRAAGSIGAVDNSFAGESFSVNDDSGAAAATFSNTIADGGGFASFADVTPDPTRGTSGEAGLMQSYLNFGADFPAETLTITGLGAAFTAPGYNVYAYFDIGAGNRTYGLTVDDGSVSSTFWTNDTGGTDSDSNDDGLMEWALATGTTSGTATTDANYALFTGFGDSSFTITGLSTSGRTVISGLQIVAVPEPSAPVMLMVAGLVFCARRRR